MNARSIYQILSGLSIGGAGFGIAEADPTVVALCAAAVPMFMLMKSQCPCETDSLRDDLTERDRREDETELYRRIDAVETDLYNRIDELQRDLDDSGSRKFLQD